MVVPVSARNKSGAWEFIRFWAGFGENKEASAQAYNDGGWLPLSPKVVQTETFQKWLNGNPQFGAFLDSTVPEGLEEIDQLEIIPKGRYLTVYLKGPYQQIYSKLLELRRSVPALKLADQAYCVNVMPLITGPLPSDALPWQVPVVRTSALS